MRKGSFKLFTLPFFLLLANIVSGQNSTIEKYRNDLAILKTRFETDYPSLYRFTNKLSIDKLFNDCSVKVNNQTTEKEFYRTIKFILSRIEDGHLSCTPSDSLAKILYAQEQYFPFSLYFSGNRIFIDCANNKMLPPGTEILKINNEKTNTIRKKLFQYIVSDGKIETKKYWILNHSFWLYYNLVYGHQENFRVQYKKPAGETTSAIVNSEFKINIDCKSLTGKEESKLLSLQYPALNTAVLTIQTFSEEDLLNSKFIFSAFLDSAFTDIKQKKINSLIIDLRGNGGGRDVYGALLYSFITDKSFRYYSKLQTSTKVLTKAEHPNLAVQIPKSNSFTGKLYIITNGLSFSAATEFCSIVKSNKRAIFVGEETGGTYCGNTSGEFIKVILPFSKITVPIPTTKYIMAVTDTKNTDRGIIPDYFTKPTIWDLLEKKDVQLDLAIKIAEKNKRR